MIRNSWYVADFGRNFKFELQKKVITGLPIVMWRNLDGEVVAFDGRCPHKGFPLWESNLLKDGTLQCGYHGFCFNGTGKCTDVPSQRDLPIAPTADLRRYPITEQDGLVWIWPGDPAKAESVKAPRIPELSSGEYEFVAADPPQKVRANYRLLIENILDITHLYPLHDGNIGNLSNSFIPAEVVERQHEGNPFVMTIRKVKNYELAPYFKRWFDLDTVDREHTHQMVGPGLIRVDLRLAPSGKLGTDEQRGYIVANCNTPIDDNNLEWRWIMMTKRGERFPADPTMTLVQGIASEFPEVALEDVWALEKQHEALEYSPEFADGSLFREVNLRADKGVVTARLALSKMEQAEGHRLFGIAVPDRDNKEAAA